MGAVADVMYKAENVRQRTTGSGTFPSEEAGREFTWSAPGTVLSREDKKTVFRAGWLVISSPHAHNVF